MVKRNRAFDSIPVGALFRPAQDGVVWALATPSFDAGWLGRSPGILISVFAAASDESLAWVGGRLVSVLGAADASSAPVATPASLETIPEDAPPADDAASTPESFLLAPFTLAFGDEPAHIADWFVPPAHGFYSPFGPLDAEPVDAHHDAPKIEAASDAPRVELTRGFDLSLQHETEWLARYGKQFVQRGPPKPIAEETRPPQASAPSPAVALSIDHWLERARQLVSPKASSPPIAHVEEHWRAGRRLDALCAARAAVAMDPRAAELVAAYERDVVLGAWGWLVLNGQHLGVSLGETARIGRVDCDVSLPSPLISRTHLLLRRDEHGLVAVRHAAHPAWSQGRELPRSFAILPHHTVELTSDISLSFEHMEDGSLTVSDGPRHWRIALGRAIKLGSVSLSLWRHGALLGFRLSSVAPFRLNDEPVFGPIELARHDRVEAGETSIVIA